MLKYLTDNRFSVIDGTGISACAISFNHGEFISGVVLAVFFILLNIALTPSSK